MTSRYAALALLIAVGCRPTDDGAVGSVEDVAAVGSVEDVAAVGSDAASRIDRACDSGDPVACGELGRVAPDGPAGSRDAAAHRGKVVLEVGDRCGVRVQG